MAIKITTIILLPGIALLLMGCPKKNTIFPDSRIQIQVNKAVFALGDTVWVESAIHPQDLGIGDKADFRKDNYNIHLSLFLMDTLQQKTYQKSDYAQYYEVVAARVLPGIDDNGDWLYVYNPALKIYELKLGFVMKKRGNYIFVTFPAYYTPSTDVIFVYPKTGKGKNYTLPLNYSNGNNKYPWKYTIEVK